MFKIIKVSILIASFLMPQFVQATKYNECRRIRSSLEMADFLSKRKGFLEILNKGPKFTFESMDQLMRTVKGIGFAQTPEKSAEYFKNFQMMKLQMGNLELIFVFETAQKSFNFEATRLASLETYLKELPLKSDKKLILFSPRHLNFSHVGPYAVTGPKSMSVLMEQVPGFEILGSTVLSHELSHLKTDELMGNKKFSDMLSEGLADLGSILSTGQTNNSSFRDYKNMQYLAEKGKKLQLRSFSEVTREEFEQLGAHQKGMYLIQPLVDGLIKSAWLQKPSKERKSPAEIFDKVIENLKEMDKLEPATFEMAKEIREKMFKVFKEFAF